MYKKWIPIVMFNWLELNYTMNFKYLPSVNGKFHKTDENVDCEQENLIKTLFLKSHDYIMFF